MLPPLRSPRAHSGQWRRKGRPRHRSAPVAAVLLRLTDPPPQDFGWSVVNFAQKGPPRLAAFGLDV